MTRYMRYWEDISLTQLLVRHIGHAMSVCNRLNDDQIYEILGGHFIDPTTHGMHRVSQEFLQWVELLPEM